ncbi:OmpP1/FadL family transporter [Roseovarius aestuariivivens]|uniref:OmpP1/FadL family transporter n=1 Tax=Roseovarius aestuariivivens TaxID=1888910 RepID=UPI001080577B|nr:outer membrane protein transport protein [Roseovarius aestuariivivens]
MRVFAGATAALALAATAGHAGEIQRDSDRSQVLYENGKNYLEFSATVVAPDVSGSVNSPFGAIPSGNMVENFQTYSLAYKREINERLTYAIIANQPYGADVNYAAGTFYPFSGTTAELNTFAVTGLLKYQFNDNFSAYGGLRVQTMDGSLRIQTAGLPPTIPPLYTLTVDKNYQVGYVLGGAYERPDIALKVALTYESEIKHDFRDNTGTSFNIKTPQAVTLHARSGIAANTLVFGSVRWQEWTKFLIAPRDYVGGLVPIARGASDIWTYELGVGRRFSENWSGAVSLGYEKDQGNVVGNLSGKDGFFSYGLAVKYQTESWDVTTGIRYIELGDAVTGIGANFSGNDALAFGMKLGFRF